MEDFIRYATVFLLLWGAGGCADAENPTSDLDGDTGGDDAGGPDAGDFDTGGSTLPVLDTLDAGWNEIAPGGDTMCARGEPFAFYVRPGTVNKLVVDFFGGGACWDEVSCAESSDTFYFFDTLDPFRGFVLDGALLGGTTIDAGIYDHARDDNPFKEWHHVLVPYCTGDIHWGDNRMDYGSVQVEHRGAVNARAVLSWIYDNLLAPEQIFVTGCSAGSYGAALWSAYLMAHYPSAQVIQFGDSGAGVATEEFFLKYFPVWNAESAYPDWIPALDPADRNIRYPDIYIGIADYYPNNFMSEFNYTYDGAQYFYYEMVNGGDLETMSEEMLASLDTIEEGAANFASFVPAGEGHCILVFDRFYTVTAGGKTLLSWINELLAEGTVKSVRETGDKAQ